MRIEGHDGKNPVKSHKTDGKNPVKSHKTTIFLWFSHGFHDKFTFVSIHVLVLEAAVVY